MNGYSATFGRAFEIRVRSDDLPAFGRPTSAASARSFRRSSISRSSPGRPTSAKRGVCRLGPANCLLPRPPLPPFATMTRAPGCARSASELVALEDLRPDRDGRARRRLRARRSSHGRRRLRRDPRGASGSAGSPRGRAAEDRRRARRRRRRRRLPRRGRRAERTSRAGSGSSRRRRGPRLPSVVRDRGTSRETVLGTAAAPDMRGRGHTAGSPSAGGEAAKPTRRSRASGKRRARARAREAGVR